MSDIISRIREVISYKGISERRFSSEIGVSAGFLSNVSDVGSSKVAKIIRVYPEINASWLLTGEGEMIKAGAEETTIIKDNQRFLDKYYNGRLLPSHYEYTMIKYYAVFPEKRIEELLELEIDTYEERYSDYAQLVNILLCLDPPKYIAEKFQRTPSPFEEYFKKISEEFEDDVIGLKNNKLKNILFILTIKDESEHFSRAISRIMPYFNSCKAIKMTKYNRGKIEIDKF